MARSKRLAKNHQYRHASWEIMRPLLTTSLLVVLAFAGCIGGGFDETSTTDSFGNTYAVFASEGTLPDDDEAVQGATARDLLTKADALAADWSAEASLFWVGGIELSEDAAGSAPFAGPSPQGYDLHDSDVGDGRAPAWNYLYLSPEKAVADACEFLFVHVAHNGFAVSYTFDPSDAQYGGDDRTSMWVCGEHAPVHSRASWTVDSDEAAAAIATADDRFAPATDGADALLWSLLVHHDSDPETDSTFDTMWLAGVFPVMGSSTDPADFLTCFTAASAAPTKTECFGPGGGTDEGGEGEGETPDNVAPENGSGEVSLAFVFTGPNSAKITLTNGSHPSLVVDFVVPANQPPAQTVVELLAPNGTVVDSWERTYAGGQESGTLTATDPVAGDWVVKVTGESGSPSITFDWCAEGYDYANETAIPCS